MTDDCVLVALRAGRPAPGRWPPLQPGSLAPHGHLPPHPCVVVPLRLCPDLLFLKDPSHAEAEFAQMNSFQPNCSLKTLSRPKPCHVEVPGLRTSTREF